MCCTAEPGANNYCGQPLTCTAKVIIRTAICQAVVSRFIVEISQLSDAGIPLSIGPDIHHVHEPISIQGKTVCGMQFIEPLSRTFRLSS